MKFVRVIVVLTVGMSMCGCWLQQEVLPLDADGGSASDEDSDGDTDGDSDGDSDGDVDGDADTDTEESFFEKVEPGFRAVWGRESDDVWFGGVETPTLHWTGSTFEELTSPYHWVFAISGDTSDVYYAGAKFEEDTLLLIEPSALIARLADSYWEEEYVGAEGIALLGLQIEQSTMGVSYAVGMNATILEKESSDWFEVNENILWWEERPYHSVWMDNSQQVLIGGVRDACLMTVDYACGGIVRYNSTAWNEMIVPEYDWGVMRIPLDMQRTADDLLWVAASGGMVYKIGNTQTQNHLVGGEYEQSDIRGLWARQSDDIWVVGENGLIVHFDGADWNYMNQDSSILFYDVWGSDSTTGIDGWADDVWAVGGVHDESTDQWMGIIMHYDGDDWMVQYPFGA